MEYFVYNFQALMLVFARVVGILFFAPIFSYPVISPLQRLILSFLLSLLIFPVVAQFLVKIEQNMIVYGFLLFSEFLVGLIISFLMNIIFAAFQIAGEFFSIQIGFAYTEILDPVTQSSTPLIGTFKILIGMLLFIALGGDRILLKSLSYSFEHISIFELNNQINQGLLKTFQAAFSVMFIVAFKIALPVVGILLIITIVEALIGKSAPQLNILQLSFPIKIVAGLLILVLTSPFVVSHMRNAFDLTFNKMHILIKEWPKTQ